MDDFLFQLQTLISQNKIQQVISTLLGTFQKCESKNPSSKDEIRDLRNQVVLLSARYTDTTDKINNGIISPMHADTAKNQLISAFLNVIGKLPDHKEYANFINGLEEEEAWEKASKANTIEAYRFFFSEYPQGKYKEETQRIISELEQIEKTKEEEFKRRAKEEKARRAKEEKRERELRAKKEQAEKEKREKEIASKANEESNIEKAKKERLAIEKEAAIAKEEQARKEMAERSKLEKEKLKQKIKEQELALLKAQKEKDEQIHENQQLKAKAKKKKEKSSKKEKPKFQPLAASSSSSFVESNSINVLENDSSDSGTLISKRNIWWTLIPFTLAPIVGLMIDFDAPEIPFSLFFLPIAYGVISYLYPRSILKGLISVSIASAVFSFIGWSSMDNPSIDELPIVFLFAFVPISFFVILILFFRNRTLRKKNN